MTASTWSPVSDVVGPCADISFERTLPGALIVTMHFSLTKGLPNRDLRIAFAQAAAIRWEEECPGLEPVPRELPKLTNPKWSTWTAPLLGLEDSVLLRSLRAIHGEHLQHFLLVSMNDLLHVVAGPSVEASWVAGRWQP